MSLFDNAKYQYRDTFFVFFPGNRRPDATAFRSALESLNEGFEISAVHADGELLESASVVCPEDYSGIDVALVSGDEVRQQIRDLMQEFKTITLVGEDSSRILQMKQYDSRFDVLHFEEAGKGDDLDPGSLLLVVQQLVALTGGIGVDPQSMSLL